MLAITMQNLQKILKQSSLFTLLPHIRTISSSRAVADSAFRLLLPQDKQEHGIMAAACHAMPGAHGETMKRLQFSPNVFVPHINTSTGKRGFCSVFGGDQEITVKERYVGAIIGSGGEVRRRMERESGASIDISVQSKIGRDRVITIEGSNEQIEHANKLIKEAIREVGGWVRYKQRQTTTITVPDGMVEYLMGGGRGRRMEMMSGASINIQRREQGDVSGDRLMYITGNDEQVEFAQKLIEEANTFREHVDKVTKITVSDDMVGTIIDPAGEN